MSKLKIIQTLVTILKGSTEDTLGELFKQINPSYKSDLTIMKDQLNLKDTDRIQNLVVLTTLWAEAYTLKTGLKSMVQMWKLAIENKTQKDLAMLISNRDIYDILSFKILVHIYEDYFKVQYADLQKIPETMADKPIPQGVKFFPYINKQIVGPPPIELTATVIDELEKIFFGTPTPDLGQEYAVMLDLQEMINFRVDFPSFFKALNGGQQKTISEAEVNLNGLRQALRLPGTIARTDLPNIVENIVEWRKVWLSKNKFAGNIKKVFDDVKQSSFYPGFQAETYWIRVIYERIYDEKDITMPRGIDTSLFLKEKMKPDDAFFEYIFRMIQPERRQKQLFVPLPPPPSLPPTRTPAPAPPSSSSPTTPEESDTSIAVIAGIMALLVLLVSK